MFSGSSDGLFGSSNTNTNGSLFGHFGQQQQQQQQQKPHVYSNWWQSLWKSGNDQQQQKPSLMSGSGTPTGTGCGQAVPSQPSSPIGGNAATQESLLFGAKPTIGDNPFGSPSTSSAFGVGTQSPGLFGQAATSQPSYPNGGNAATQESSLFGAKPTIGDNPFGSPSASSAFGVGTQSPGLFGQAATSQPSYPNGGNAATQESSLFGAKPTIGDNPFGSPSASSAFGVGTQSPGLFGQAATSQPSYPNGGNAATQESSLFGAKPVTDDNIFGSPSMSSAFAGTQSSGHFGQQQKPAFGQTQTSTPSLFGISTTTTGFGEGFGAASSIVGTTQKLEPATDQQPQKSASFGENGTTEISTNANSISIEDKLDGCLEAIRELKISSELNRYRVDRGIGVRTINKISLEQGAMEAYYRETSRTFKQRDKNDALLRKRLRLEGLVLDRCRSLPERDDFPAIPADAINLIGKIWSGGPLNEVFVKGFGVDITRKDLLSLKGLDWLNDEVINFYMNLICERSTSNKDGLPKVYAFNTFFLPNLKAKGYSSVRRWTRKVDIFSFHILIVPVHLGVHWCLAIIDLENKSIEYYDSLFGSDLQALERLREYVSLEAKDKKQKVMDTSDWTLQTRKDIPRQTNGSDCGMFTCKFAEYASRRAEINFSQHEMPYFRQRMVHEICSKKLM